MRIAVFTNNYLPNPYGVSGSVESFRTEFESMGHEVFVFAPKWKGYTDENARVFRYPSVDIEVKIKFPLAIPYSRKISEVLEKLDLDIIHSQHPNLLGSAAKHWAKKKNIPLIFTWHTLYDQYAHFVPFIPKRLAAWWTVRNAKNYANRCYAVITPTPSVIEIIRDWGVTNKKIYAVPTGVAEKQFANPDRKSIREKYSLRDDEILVVDAGVKISNLREAGVERYEIRLATNFTARRKYLPKHHKGRKPKYGALVRPLPRKHKDKILQATTPDETYTWVEDERELRAEIWRNLVLNKTVPNENNKTFDVYAIYDPDFDQPWLLATPVTLQPESVRAIYKDRWPVEQIPLSAKQMVGAHRQFVHNSESIQRLPELALLAGSILSFLATTQPAAPTGFWDRKPKRTPGRLRRTLIGKPFPKDAILHRRLREKHSVTTHLPKGILAHRQKTTTSTSFAVP